MSFFGPVSVLAECPRWDAETSTLSWVDIDGGTLCLARREACDWDWTAREMTAPLAGSVRSVTQDGESGRVNAVGRVLMTADWTRQIETDRALRLNELVTDPIGRLWVGSMAYDWTPGAGSIYRVDRDLTIARVITEVTIANGIGWSPDGDTMYTTDTPTSRITAWSFDAKSGTPRRPRVLIEVKEPGFPDGLAIDTDGNLWSAIAGGGYVACFSPNGTELHREPIPVPIPTSCCFAGPARDRLIVTTSRKRLDPEMLAAHPDSGRVWDAGRIGAIGVEQMPFGGHSL